MGHGESHNVVRRIQASDRKRGRVWVADCATALIDILFVGLIAVGVRCYRLGVIPIGLDRDAAANGLYALDLLQRGIWPFFVLHMGVAEPLMVYLQSVSIALLGSSVVALRIVSALAGGLTACGVYVLARLLWPEEGGPWARYGALIGGMGLALCPVHIHVSRMGLRAILSPFLEVITLAAFAYSWRTNRRSTFILAGVALGVGMYSYLAFRVMFLLMPVTILVLFVSDPSRVRKRWSGLLVMAGCAALVVIPAIPFYARYPMALWGRVGQVMLWQQPLAAERGWWHVFLLKLWAQVKMLAVSWPGQYNEMGFSLLDPVLLATFLAGLGRMLFYGRIPRYQGRTLRYQGRALRSRVGAYGGFAASALPNGDALTRVLISLGLAVMLLPDLFSDRLSPHALRVLGIAPFVFLVVGLGGMSAGRWVFESRLWSRIELSSINGRVWRSVFALVLMSASGIRFYRYLAYWDPSVQRSDGVLYNLADVAEAEHLIRGYDADTDHPPDVSVLIPLAEYERTVLRYLSGGAFSVHLSSMDELGQMRTDMWEGDCVLLMPHDPDRKRLEGPTFSFDPAQYALLRENKVYLLPPLDDRGEHRLAALMAGAPRDLVRDVYGRDVATVYRLTRAAGTTAGCSPSALSLSFLDRVTHRLGTDFDGQIELVGYALPDWHLQPGGGSVTVAFFWRARQSLGENYRLFVHLLDQNDGVLSFGDTVPGMGTYPTTFWRTDEWVPTFHRLSVPAGLPPGRYQIEVGFFDPLSLDRLPVVGARGETIATRVLVRPLKVSLANGATKADDATGAATGDVPLSMQRFRLGEAISLTGYELIGQEGGAWTARPGDVIPVRLAWIAHTRPAADYSFFLHLASEDEHILAQYDAQPLEGTYPTGIWERGEVVVERVLLSVPDDVTPGLYRLWTGMYSSVNNHRLPASDEMGRRLPDDRVPLGAVRVLEKAQ